MPILGTPLDHQPADPAGWSDLFATDADLAAQCVGDYANLMPRHQALALAKDGAFAPGDRWKLTSASTYFPGQGVGPGNVLILDNGGVLGAHVADVLEVVESDPLGVLLKRLDAEASGLGLPPAPEGGSAGLSFRVPTARRLIASATAEFRERYGLLLGQPDTGQVATVRRATAYRVLAELYLAKAQQAGDKGKDDWTAKHDYYAGLARDLVARLDALLIVPGPGGRFASYRPREPDMTPRLSL